MPMLRLASLFALTLMVAIAAAAEAQQPSPPPTATSTCSYQYKDAPGTTPAQLLGRGFEIKTGWPGGLWLQKDKDAYFCNSGRTTKGAVICWTMIDPVDSASCQ
jgi:hypothetical protein